VDRFGLPALMYGAGLLAVISVVVLLVGKKLFSKGY
jgi:hypothetical protein